MNTLVADVTQWGHALAAIMFALLVGWQATVRNGGARRLLLTFACAFTALWCAGVSRAGIGEILPSIAKNFADLCWLGWLLVLQPPVRGDRRQPIIVGVYLLVVTLIAAAIVLKLLPFLFGGSPRIQEGLFLAGWALRVGIAASALCLLHNFFTAAPPEGRWRLGMPMLALAAMWIFDLNLAMVAYLTEDLPQVLYAVRGLFLVLAAPLLVTVSRLTELDRMRPARAARFEMLSLAVMAFYFAVMLTLDKLLALSGNRWRLGQVTIALFFLLFAGGLFPSERFRKSLKASLARHLFQHRYDYRHEWRRFTETVGQPGEGGPPIAERTIKAIADIPDSPGGVLLLRGPDGGLDLSARFGWADLDAPLAAGSAELAALMERDGRIIELAGIRADSSAPETPLIPEWMLAEESAWLIVPLIHFDSLVGAVLLEAPLISRLLDWEDHDLLRVAGRQVASYLAEARGQEALSDARRFDEFNRRFAFIMHDIKNLVSQLSLLARNAERHADNPEFRADMIDTLKSSVGKMNDLLARLSQHHRSRADEPAPHSLRDLAQEVVRGRTDGHPVRVSAPDEVMAMVDPDRFTQALGHLIQNAVDASPADAPVEIVVSRHDLEAAVEVIDHGAGMSADFVRTRLFQPFASTKDGGFGVGAFEARSIIAAMKGRIEVQSREGEGSRFTIILPMAAFFSGDRSTLQ